jgi:uroporphyrinogen III methyltransferase / synthase
LNNTNSILSGKTILVTRSKEASTEFCALLISRGAETICLPTIEITDPDSWQPCDDAIWKLAEFDSVCFTSKNAVEKIVQRIRLLRPQALNTLATRNIYAVGEKTKSALEAAGFEVQPIPSSHSAEELAQSFYGQDIAEKHFLFPKSNIARDILPKELRSLGAVVEEIEAYKTIVPESGNLEHIRSLLNNGTIKVVTFFSPSSVRNFLEMIGCEALQQVLVAAIGPTTAEAVKEAGLIASIIPDRPTSDAMVESLEQYFNTN